MNDDAFQDANEKAATRWSAESVPALLRGTVDSLQRRHMTANILATVQQEVVHRRAQELGRLELERKERDRAADLVVDIDYCRLTVAQRNAQMGYIGASVLDSLHDESTFSAVSLAQDARSFDQDSAFDSLLLEMQASAASSDYFLTKPLDNGPESSQEGTQLASDDAAELAKQNAVLRRLLRSLREEEPLPASAAEELDRLLHTGEDPGGGVQPRSVLNRGARRWHDGGSLALPHSPPPLHGIVIHESDAPVIAPYSAAPAPQTLAPLVLPASRQYAKLSGKIPPSPLDTAPCNLKAVPLSTERKPRPALPEQESDSASTLSPPVGSPHDRAQSPAAAARLRKRQHDEAEARGLKRLLLFARAEDEMKKIDKAERERARRLGLGQGPPPDPPRVRLISTPLTLPELDAEETERVARKAITKMRVKISGGNISFISRPYSRVESMLLENPFATPVLEKYQKLVEKAQKERRLEEIRLMGQDVAKEKAAKGRKR